MIDGAEAERLLGAARSAASKAYAPYSELKIGAALITETGKVYTGANVENAAYGECLCAERVAVAKAVSEGDIDLVAMAVAAADGRDISPCGACRQVMQEFNPELYFITEGGSGGVRLERVSQLLPRPFDL